ncbi:MAG TPA: tetraacyldisaccharide 4'-kinase [Flavobacteriales bacterium]|jgi:tetraacyldisaccharide 4'-kinase|nr:tetraacyldisaccharide 4'-kinase [Flavobacteriales bacterium]
MTTKILIRRIVFAPFSALHGIGLYLRHLAYDFKLFKSEKGRIPTLVIGNLHAGGTGKTPHASIFLKILARKLGGAEHVALLSRGYGRKTKGFFVVEEDTDWHLVGDEPKLLKSLNPNHPIVVCENRLVGIKDIASQFPKVKVVVLDDGLQHRALIPDRSVLLIDSNRPIESQALLPSGDLRDLKYRAKEFDAWIYTRNFDKKSFPLPKSPSTEENRIAVFSSEMVVGNEFERIDKNSRPRVLAVSGVAAPERFMDGLAKNWDVVRRQSYSDHYEFTAKDINNWVICINSENLEGIVTTAKDAVRIKPFMDALKGVRLVIIPLSVKWHDSEAIENWVDEWLESPIFATSTRTK